MFLEFWLDLFDELWLAIYNDILDEIFIGDQVLAVSDWVQAHKRTGAPVPGGSSHSPMILNESRKAVASSDLTNSGMPSTDVV